MEDLFVGLLAGGITPGKNVHPRVKFHSHSVARDVMLGGRAYVDWLPYNFTHNRAEAFFRGAFPFCNLDKSDRKLLERIVLVRNAVAHQSRAARLKFEDEVIGTTPVLPIERTPAGFLRTVFRTAPDQTRYEEIATACAILARKLCQQIQNAVTAMTTLWTNLPETKCSSAVSGCSGLMTAVTQSRSAGNTTPPRLRTGPPSRYGWRLSP